MPEGQMDEPADGPVDGRTDRRPAGELEASVLAALWAADAPLTPGAVQLELGGGLARTTVTTILTRLHAKGAVVGWYMYYANKGGGRSEVLQLVADPEWTAPVFDSLAHDAWLRGATSLCGVLHPSLLAPLATRRARTPTGSFATA